MEENSKKALFVGIGVGSAILSVLGLCYCVDQTNSMKRMIGASADKISRMSQIDVDRMMVDRLVEESVRKQATDIAREAAYKAKDEVVADMRNRVKQAVNSQSGDIAKRVGAKIAREISETDKNDIIDDVIEAATDKLIDKLGEDLDSEIGRIGRIYKGIAAAARQ